MGCGNCTKRIAKHNCAGGSRGVRSKGGAGKFVAAKEKLAKRLTKQAALVKDAKKKSAAADDVWASYLKDFADQKSSDAKEKKVTKLDPWNIAMAKAAEPQKGAGGVDCTSVGNKFKTIIYEARTQYMGEAKKKCVAKGNEWADF